MKEKEEVKNLLLSVIKQGDTIYGLVRHVAPSGMSRHISFFIPLDGGIQDISWHIAKVLGYKQADNGALKVSGCGMDMVFYCIYELGRQLFGFDDDARHWNYHTGRNGDKGPETDGGYFLKEGIL